MGILAGFTDQALVTQLEHVEDAIGAIPAFLPSAEGPQLLNGALLDLLVQEVNIVGELRIRLSSSGVGSGADDRAPTARGSSMERGEVQAPAGVKVVR